MKVVVDASFILDFLLPDEHAVEVIETFEQYQTGEIQFISPLILPFEVVNGLKSAVVAKRIEDNVAARLLGIFLKIDIDLVEVDIRQVLHRALEEELSVYDAAYLVCAEQKDLSLLTLDSRLAKLAR